jgi:polyisoprenoid-binding protein YceI
MKEATPMRVQRITTAVFVSLLIAGATRAADSYKIDPAHTSVGFTISHLVISEVNGRFNAMAGELALDKDALTGANATIQVKSVDTGIGKRDDHLRSPDFFDAEKFPTITFESTKVEKDHVTGKFTMHGVTKEIQLPFVLKGPIKDPWGATRVAITAETTINRTDYGMKSMTGVGDEVKIKIVAEATKTEAPKTEAK